LFEHRFADELIDSASYFEDACAYVLLNPVRTRVPMACSAESYPWSSAELVCTDTTPERFVASILERLGGAEAVTARLGKPARKSTRELRQRRLEALAAGRWMAREAVLGGRSAEAYRRALAVRAARGEQPAPARGPEQDERSAAIDGGVRGCTPWVIHSAEPWGGLELSSVTEEIERMCARVVPAALGAAGHVGDLVCYALYRFASCSVESLGAALGSTAEVVEEQVRRVRGAIRQEPAWRSMVWAVEWGLRWRLLAGPHRT
jgi:hypothetical protein